MTIKQWMKTPKYYVTITLIGFLLLASIGTQSFLGIYKTIIAIVVGVALDVILSLFEKRKRIFPDGAGITGLIIGLILGTVTSIGIVAATAAIAILSKHLIVYKKKPIFNPAAFGLFISILLFHTQQSWWGAFGDLPGWTNVFLLVGGYIVVNRVNKLPQVLMFLGVSFALLFVLGLLHFQNIPDAFRPPFINATLFFGFFMLTDPPTTPGRDKDQLIFSLVVSIIGTLIYGFFGGLMYLFIGLFIGNLMHVVKRRLDLKNIRVHQNMKHGKRMSS